MRENTADSARERGIPELRRTPQFSREPQQIKRAYQLEAELDPRLERENGAETRSDRHELDGDAEGNPEEEGPRAPHTEGEAGGREHHVVRAGHDRGA